MESRVTVKGVKSKLEKLDYWRFERDFQGQQNQVSPVYWNCVALDIIQNISSVEQEKYIQEFAARLHTSFLGCFYKAHELHQYLLTRFDGLHKVYRFEEPYKTEWNKWKSELDKEQAHYLQLILTSISENYIHDELVRPNTENQRINLTSFDGFQEYLGQPLYNMFLMHLKCTQLGNLKKPPVEILLPYQIAPSFISNLHDYAHSFLKARTIKFTLNRVDNLFGTGNNIISAYERAQPKKAVEDLLQRFPEYKPLSDSQLSNIVRLTYQDEEGNELKLNTIRKILKKLRNH